MSKLETPSEFEPVRIVFSRQLGVATFVSPIIDGRVNWWVAKFIPRGDDGLVDVIAPTNDAACVSAHPH